MDETRDDRDTGGLFGSLGGDDTPGADSGQDRGGNDDLAPTVLDEVFGQQRGSQNPDLGEEDVDQSAGGA
jgi:hypothetical protein